MAGGADGAGDFGFDTYERQSQPDEGRGARIRATACKKATSKLSASSDSTQIGEVLRVFVGERFDRTGQALTSGDCREILQEAGRADELCDKCRHILELCEMSQFAGAGIDSQVNVDEVMELIRKIDREGK